MANPTMTLIASNTVGSGGVSSVTFSSIPQTYTDLVVKVSARGTSGYENVIAAQFNGDASLSPKNYQNTRLYGNGTAAASDTLLTNYIQIAHANGPSGTANTFTNCEFYIPNYTSSNYKSTSSDYVVEQNLASTGTYQVLVAGLWQSTSAITSIALIPTAGNFTQYSTFYLYGISNS